jgi:hypothetical protein
MSAQELILRTSSKSATTAMQSPVILVIPACDEAASIGRVLSEVPPELVADVLVVVAVVAADPTTRVAAAQGALSSFSRAPAMALRAGRANALPPRSALRSSCSSTATTPILPWSWLLCSHPW